tara:strand:+ start:482 stop:607 length:126 start_codon:yes stop_codon:yes gene_type:complete
MPKGKGTYGRKVGRPKRVRIRRTAKKTKSSRGLTGRRGARY